MIIMPEVSIIVPVYNVEQYIGRTIESVQKQILTDWELLLIDDCGLDNSIVICEKYAALDSRIKVFKHIENQGPMKARQTGINHALGDYLFFLDGDDTLPPKSLKILREVALETGAEIVRGQIDLITISGRTIPFGRDILPYSNNIEGILRALLEGKMRHNLASALFKRELFIKHKYLVCSNMRNGEDGLMFFQLVQNLSSPIQIIQDVVYCYYENEQSSSHILKSDLALRGLIFYYSYVSDLPYPNLKHLCMTYATKHLHEFALDQGFLRVKSVVRAFASHPFLSFRYRLKYMTVKQVVRFYVKYIVKFFNRL